MLGDERRYAFIVKSMGFEIQLQDSKSNSTIYQEGTLGKLVHISVSAEMILSCPTS